MPLTPARSLDYLISTAPGDHDRVASHRADEPLCWALDGRWRFHFSPTATGTPDGAEASGFDDSVWDPIDVPSHFVLAGEGRWGQPIYTNVQFPIPLDPPHVPDGNPTGDYRLTFWLPGGEGEVEGPRPREAWAEWADFERVLLRFDGLESLGLVHLNGVRLGVVRGSRLRSELDVSSVVRPGRNVLHVRVHQWSAMTYVEDQDQWWLPGIFRSVSLVGRPRGGVDDLWLDARYDHRTGRGSIVLEVIASDDAFPLTVRIEGLGFEHTFATAAELVPLDVGPVTPWDCDVPKLYAVSVQASGETVGLRVGFRTVQVVGRELHINGRPLRMRGVNRHEFDADRGRIVGHERTRADLVLMKQSGMNTVRTAHYPPDPSFLDHCDELGLFVVLENDLETHGFERAGWLGNPSDDPAWREHLLDRMRRTVERDKNHPSVIMWSLGNESGTGANLAAMSAWTRRRDPGRPVHYEGDHAGSYTDVQSFMYTPVEGLADLSAGVGTALSDIPGQAARLTDRPVMLCEFVHAMGNGPGGVADYERAFDTLPGVIGGLVWEWRDHGLRTTINGRPDFAYGGDFGETVHDGTFVIDGLTSPDGAPSPGLAEVAGHFAPIRLEIQAAAVRVRNLRHSQDTSDLAFTLVVDGPQGEPEHRRLDVPVVVAGEAVVVPLPEMVESARERWISVTASLAEDAAWASAGHVIARVQAVVDAEPADRVPTKGPTLDGWQVGPVLLDAATGNPVSWAGVEVSGSEVSLWRAPTSNDSFSMFGSYELGDVAQTRGLGVPGPSSAARWRAAGLDRLETRLESICHEGDRITIRRRQSAAQATWGIDVVEQWREVEGDALVSLDIHPFGDCGSTWPRVGWHLVLPTGYSDARWVGTGPGESYADSDAAVWLGRFESTIDDLGFSYVVPQESGHRPGLRHLEVVGAGLPTLEVTAGGPGGPGFTLARHDAHELDRAAHRSALPDSRGVHLYLDAAQHGLGSRACGPDVRPAAQLWPRSVRIDVVLGVSAT